MNRRRVRALLRKEWAEARRNRMLSWTFGLVALVITVLPLLVAFGLIKVVAAEMTADPQVNKLLAVLVAQLPGLGALPRVSQLQVLVLRQSLPLFLVLPLVGAMTSATYSIVGERATRSLEPLLATPLTTGEMLLGKALAVALPSVLVTWLAFTVFAAATCALGGTRMASLAVGMAGWLTLLLVTPGLALFGMGAGVLVSARAKDPRAAQQVGTLLLLPMMALLVAQIAGAFLLGPGVAVGGAALIFALDGALLGWGRRLFDRERLLTEWR